MAKQPLAFDKLRIETFSDTLIAVVIVSMTLNLRIPDDWTAEALAALGWQIAAYLLSFVVLGILWVNHRQLAAALDSAPRGFQWLNLHALFWVSLIPMTTAYAAAHPLEPRALAAYSGLFAVVSLSFTLLRHVLSKLKPDNTALAQVNFSMSYRSLAAAMIFGAGAPLAFITPYAAMACLAAVPLMFFVPVGAGHDRH